MTPHVTTADIARWRRLLRETARCAANRDLPLGDLDQACRAARRSVVPAGKADKANPFVRLVRLVQRFVVADALARHEMTVELSGLTTQCEQLLGPPKTGPTVTAASGDRAARLPYRDE